MVKFLVEEKNFDVNSKDQQGTSSLFLACCAQVVQFNKSFLLQIHEEPEDYKINRRRTVEFLLKNNADIDSWGSPGDKKIVYSPIYAAAYSDDLELVMSLVNANISLSLGVSPLFNSVCAARVEITDFLVKKFIEQNLDLNCKDIYGKTPLECALLEYKDEEVETNAGGGNGTLNRIQSIIDILQNALNLQQQNPINEPKVKPQILRLALEDNQNSIPEESSPPLNSTDRKAKRKNFKMNRSTSEKERKKLGKRENTARTARPSNRNSNRTTPRETEGKTPKTPKAEVKGQKKPTDTTSLPS